MSARTSSTPARPKPGLAVITIDEQGQNCILVIPGANDEATEEDVQIALRSGSYDAVLLQLEFPSETVIATCSLAAARGLPVVIDAGPAQSFPIEQLRGVTILTPNETETLSLTGIRPETKQDAQAAAKILVHRCDAKAIAIKLGKRGALLYERDGVCELFLLTRCLPWIATPRGTHLPQP